MLMMMEMVFMCQAADARQYAAERIVDCTGCIISPGLIDLQLNGGWRCDFSTPADCTPDNVRLTKCI
jgi:N-acetylglucosamine-6-phosphate deacetylase